MLLDYAGVILQKYDMPTCFLIASPPSHPRPPFIHPSIACIHRMHPSRPCHIQLVRGRCACCRGFLPSPVSCPQSYRSCHEKEGCIHHSPRYPDRRKKPKKGMYEGYIYIWMCVSVCVNRDTSPAFRSRDD